MKRWMIHLIIIGFALLHCLTTVLCETAGINDELFLTFFTMVMVALICIRRKMSIEFTAVAIVIANLLGYAVGFALQPVMSLLPTALGPAPISTFCTTIVLGYLTYGASLLIGPEKDQLRKDTSIVWIMGAVALIFMARILIMQFFNSGHGFLSSERFLYFVASFIVLMFVLFIFIGSYVILEKRRIKAEKEKRHLEQFRYMRLSQQVNPHFLFNSLNILDALIVEQKNQQASIYVHKLASLYRYLLKNEEETTVKLRDELEFVDKYVDLLKVRFQDGLEYTVDVDQSAMMKSVVPCSIQLLIENATKHNSISSEDPLSIKVKICSEKIVVSNNLRPKVSSTASTGLGLKYISQQYKDLTGKDIIVVQTDSEYVVELPLI